MTPTYPPLLLWNVQMKTCYCLRMDNGSNSNKQKTWKTFIANHKWWQIALLLRHFWGSWWNITSHKPKVDLYLDYLLTLHEITEDWSLNYHYVFTILEKLILKEMLIHIFHREKSAVYILWRLGIQKSLKIFFQVIS